MELNQHFTFYLESLRTAEKAIIEEKKAKPSKTLWGLHLSNIESECGSISVADFPLILLYPH